MAPPQSADQLLGHSGMPEMPVSTTPPPSVPQVPRYDTNAVEIVDQESESTKFWTREEHERFLEALRMYGVKGN